MFTDVQIINLGLSKFASSRIARIDPPQTSLERFCAAGYDHWKRTEIGKRRWVFAYEEAYVLTLSKTIEGAERPYVYELPTDCLRPIRRRGAEWVQRKRTIHSAHSTLTIPYIQNVKEIDFDPLFVEVLAARIALETVEYVTQSNTKKADIDALYQRAVADASQSNAFVVGPEDNAVDDASFPFVSVRY